MSKFQLKEAFPTILSTICFLVFMQKILYGINTYNPGGLFGIPIIDFNSIFLIAFALFIFGYALYAARNNSRITAKKTVLAAGVLSLPATGCLLFNVPDLFSPFVSSLLVVLSSLLLFLSFCIVLFAWLNRMKEESSSSTIRSVLLSVLVGAFIYSVMTPSNNNSSLYMLLLELAALPVAAISYALPWKINYTKHQHTRPSNREGMGYLISAALFLFLVLMMTYVDFLNEGYPVEHVEQPTFYALLLISVAAFVAIVYRDNKGELISNGSTQRLIQVLGAFFLIAYIVVFYFASTSYEFCFQFTCLVRRLTIIVFYTVVLSLTFIYNLKIEISIGIMFFVPFCLARAIMRIFYNVSNAGVIANTADFQLTILLAIGILLILCVVFSWYLHSRTKSPAPLFNPAAQNLADPFADSARFAAVTMLSEEYALSEREKEIFYYLSMGYSINRIAELLFIANNTVGTHIRSIYKKMQLHNKQDAIDLVNETIVPSPN